MTVRDRLLSFFVRKWVIYRKTGDDIHLRFNGMQLERIDQKHPLSGLRIARYIRIDNLVEFECAKRDQSLYVIKNVSLQGIAADLRKRKAKWTRAELVETQRLLLNAITEEPVAS